MNRYVLGIVLVLVFLSCGIVRQETVRTVVCVDGRFCVDTTAELIEYTVLRYHVEDTTEYLLFFDYNVRDVPDVIRRIYVYYNPVTRRGVMGIRTVSDEERYIAGYVMGDHVPYYTLDYRGDSLSFECVGEDDRLLWGQKDEGIYSRLLGFFDVEIVYSQMYHVKYEYLSREDLPFNEDLSAVELLSHVPMFSYELDKDVYIRGELVKKRLGYMQAANDNLFNSLPEYRHEIDTALLALPVNILIDRCMNR